MEKYTKINSIYKRYQRIGKKDCPNIPNDAWRVMANKIILGDFSDKILYDLCNIPLDASEKIDGTNSKIAYYPSTCTFKVGGKTDNAQSQSGQFEKLTEIAERILPILKELFPKECARFVPLKNENNQTITLDTNTILCDSMDSLNSLAHEYSDDVKYVGVVPFVEVPIYLYGEYYGNKIQKGDYYCKGNEFALFDINQQGWWLPRKEFNELANKLEIPIAPYMGNMTILNAENIVKNGFPTAIGDSGHLAEGIVLKHPYLRDNRGNRIIIKIKHCDYHEYNTAVKTLSNNDEIAKFMSWYKQTIEPNV